MDKLIWKNKINLAHLEIIRLHLILNKFKYNNKTSLNNLFKMCNRNNFLWVQEMFHKVNK